MAYGARTTGRRPHRVRFLRNHATGDATIRTRAALKTGVTTDRRSRRRRHAERGGQGFFEFSERVEDLPAADQSSEAQLAILPAGTGDDFARSQMGQRENPGNLDRHSHFALSRRLHERTFDWSMFSTASATATRRRSFVSTLPRWELAARRPRALPPREISCAGFLVRRGSQLPALAALAGWRERRVRVSIDDDEVIDGNMNLVAVANALYAGGGMMLSPEAKIDDGKLDVVTASGLSRAKVVRELARIHKGGHVANPKVRITQGKGVSIETFSPEDAMPIEADGNVRGVTPVEFRVMPRALRFVVG